MTQKFDRNYRLTIYPLDKGDPIIITRPFTINFSLLRDTASEMNKMDLEIYNLSETHRKRIFQDRYVLGNYTDSNGNQILNDQGDPIGSHNIILEIGYENLYRVWYGRMLQASSAREGTNIITKIQSLDGNSDIASSQISQTIQQGQSVSSILKTLIGQFPSLKLGTIGNFPDILQRPVVLNGNTWQLVKQYSAGNVCIDNGQVHALLEHEVFEQVNIINDATGILNTPRRCEGYLEVTTLLEAGISINQQVQLQSTVLPEYNGTYKVIGLMHTGTISSAVCGNLRSIFRLLAPNQFKAFTVVKAA